MAEKFLILGANSFYGANFVKLLREKGEEVHEINRGLMNVLNDVRALEWRDEDYIVNFISQSSVAESWDNPELWLKVNAVGLTSMLEALRAKINFKKFIHVSTPEVYGSVPWWVEEHQSFNPTTPYAVSRAAGDMMLKAYFKAYGFPMLITRTANIYGPGQQPFRVIPLAIQHKRDGKRLPLHGGGWSKRSFIHIKDACEATYLLCKEGMLGQTYHISTKEAHWIREVVSMIGCEYEQVEDRLGKDAYYLLDSEKLRRMGWKDKITLEEGLKECELSH